MPTEVLDTSLKSYIFEHLGNIFTTPPTPNKIRFAIENSIRLTLILLGEKGRVLENDNQMNLNKRSNIVKCHFLRCRCQLLLSLIVVLHEFLSEFKRFITYYAGHVMCQQLTSKYSHKLYDYSSQHLHHEQRTGILVIDAYQRIFFNFLAT